MRAAGLAETTDGDEVHAHAIGPGSELVGRYRIEDLVGETTRSQTWRAVDRILDRSVSVQALPTDDPAATGFLTAARAATAVEDSRFLRVLDAAREDGTAYVVREWTRGVSLDTVLRQGPLPTPRAVEVVREVADAIAAAHRVGVHHERLDPARVIVKHNGAVRVLGLATDKALQGAGDEDDPAAGETADVSALGRLLYACVTARWPGGRDLGLPAAPTEHGRLLRPRQVRAGVDRAVDTVCDRVLGTPPRHHATPLRTASEVARELVALPRTRDVPHLFADEDDATMPRGVLPVAPDGTGPPPAVHQVPPPRAGPAAQPPPPPEPRPHTGARGPVWVGIALLVAMAAVLAIVVSQAGTGALTLPGADADDETTQTPRTAAAVGPIDIAGVSAFDPQGTDGYEHDEDAPAAADGDPATTWETQEYYVTPDLAGLKEGVGLLVDLSDEQDVSQVDVALVGGPTSVSVLAAPGATTPPTGVAALTRVASAEQVGTAGTTEEVPLELDETVSTRFLVVWLTRLPPVEDGVYVGSIAEMAVSG